MSHVVTIQTEVRDPAAVQAACRRRQLPPPRQGTFRLFSAEASGLAVELPDWKYPVVCDTASGQVRYDDYGGAWGDRKHLDAFLQAYSVERATIEARRQGHSVSDRRLADGSIQLTVHVGE